MRLPSFVHAHYLVDNVCKTFAKKLQRRYFRIKHALLPYDIEVNKLKFARYKEQNVKLVVRFRLSDDDPAEHKKVIATNGDEPFAMRVLDQIKYHFFEEGVDGYYRRLCNTNMGLPGTINFIDVDLGNIKKEEDMLEIGNGEAFAGILANLFNVSAKYLSNNKLVSPDTFPEPFSPEY